jgi:hypothetical protein
VQHGLLVDLRFAYSRDFGGAEPSFQAILRHQQQLAPIVHEYAYVINTLSLGMIGPWGEQHTVRSAGFEESDDAGAYPKRLQLLRGWLNAAPPGLIVTLRYPQQLQWMTEQGGLTSAELAQTGIYNDGFLANVHHDGTFRGDPAEIVASKAWLAEYTKTHPSRAESNVGSGTKDNNPTYARTSDNWLEDGFGRYHVDTLREWGLVETALKGMGRWVELQGRLGYRLVLENATLPSTVTPGQRVVVELSISNEGFAAPRRPHQALLMFGSQPAALDGVDVREWGPGRHSIRAEVTVPQLAGGDHQLSLALPDAHPALRSDARYAIQLANGGVWQSSSGVNALRASVRVLG